MNITFTLSLRVSDADELVRAAQARAVEEGLDTDDIACTYTIDDLPACVQMLLDPGSVAGCSVYESSASED